MGILQLFPGEKISSNTKKQTGFDCKNRFDASDNLYTILAEIYRNIRSNRNYQNTATTHTIKLTQSLHTKHAQKVTASKLWNLQEQKEKDLEALYIEWFGSDIGTDCTKPFE